MKKRFLYFFIPVCLLLAASTLSSCSRKSGCPAEEATTKIKKNPKPGTTNLWSKKQRKRQ